MADGHGRSPSDETVYVSTEIPTMSLIRFDVLGGGSSDRQHSG